MTLGLYVTFGNLNHMCSMRNGVITDDQEDNIRHQKGRDHSQ